MNRPVWGYCLVAVIAALVSIQGCAERDGKHTGHEHPAPAPQQKSAEAAPTPDSGMGELELVETRTPAPTSADAKASSPTPAPKSDKAGDEQPKRVTYAPHILIDWSVPQVEIDAKVVLRDRKLELLLCSEGTKEHESILATPAKPSKIYEALGLIGLEPGTPPSYDPVAKTATAPSGDRLGIEIVTKVPEGTRTDTANQWMALADSDEALPPPNWVFCGSRKLENGALAADSEGTIISVVDFDSSLIGIGESHDASDANLWVKTDTSMIPEIGTECTVVIRALDDAPIELVLTPENFFKWNDRVLDALELDTLIRERTRHNPDQKVTLTEMPGEPNPFARLAAHAIVGSGIKRENLTANLLPRPEETPPAPSAPSDDEEMNSSSAE